MAEPRRALGEGAAQEAPTAPHATPRTGGGGRTGPERFWSRWPVRVALGACALVSLAAHCAVVPLELPHGFETREVEGETAIPIDILEQEDTPPPPEPPPPEPPAQDDSRARAEAAALAMARAHDAGPRDAGSDAAQDAASDAASDAPADAASDAPTDAPTDGPGDGGASGAGLEGGIAQADAGPPAVASRDPDGISGVAGTVQAGDILVRVVVSGKVIRATPFAGRMGNLLRGIDQWKTFMDGTEFNPVRDVDWVMISGPSLINTSRDVILLRYSASDAAVDKAVDLVSRRSEKGDVSFDAGVPGVRATRAFADRAERVILRPQPRLMALAPPSDAQKIARQLTGARVPEQLRPAGEAAFVKVKHPSGPFPQLPASITEARLRVVPRAADGGADVFLEGDTKDAAAASQAADQLRDLLRDQNNFWVKVATGRLLDGAEVTTRDNLVLVHIPASREQIDTTLNAIEAFAIPPPAPPPP